MSTSDFSWRSASMREKNMAVGTSQRGVEAGKPINNIQVREASVRNRTLFALFPACVPPGTPRGTGMAAGENSHWLGQKLERRSSPRRSKVKRAKIRSLRKQKGGGKRKDGTSLLPW
jgi:hypothetical protein